jgi:hypothetical protein
MSNEEYEKWMHSYDADRKELLDKLGLEDYSGYGGLETAVSARLVELQKEQEAISAKKVELEQKIILNNQKLVNLTMKDVQLAESRALIRGTKVERLKLGYTDGSGPGSFDAMVAEMHKTVADQKIAIASAATGVIGGIARGGGDAALAGKNEWLTGALTPDKQLEFLEMMGTSTEDEFMKNAGQFLPGVGEDQLRNLRKAYEFGEEYKKQIDDIGKARVQNAQLEANANLTEFDRKAMLLDLDQKRLDTQINIANALHLPMTVQSELIKQQIELTQKQIGVEEDRLSMLQRLNAEGAKNADDIKQQKQVLVGLYGQLSNQVDYIRRSWEEVFTMTSMNLPSGSYILPTTTGLMEKGPSFAPYTPAPAGGGGYGTYEAFMGYGKAEAFSQLGKYLENAINGITNASHVFDGGANKIVQAAADMASGTD